MGENFCARIGSIRPYSFGVSILKMYIMRMLRDIGTERSEKFFHTHHTPELVCVILALGPGKLQVGNPSNYDAEFWWICFVWQHFARESSARGIIERLQDLADRCHVSASHVYHLFKKTLGMTPTQYINEIRIEKAASKIRHSDMKLDEIACITGFSSTSYFREVFKAHTGITPAQYRANLATEKG